MQQIEVKGGVKPNGAIAIVIMTPNIELITDESGAIALANVLIETVRQCQESPRYRNESGCPFVVVNANTGNLLNFDRAPQRRGWFPWLRRRG